MVSTRRRHHVSDVAVLVNLYEVSLEDAQVLPSVQDIQRHIAAHQLTAGMSMEGAHRR